MEAGPEGGSQRQNNPSVREDSLFILGAPPNKGHPISVRYFISVYNDLLQKMYIDNLALGLGVICAKDGGYSIINEKVRVIFVRHDFL